jgi:hypothetical protein
MKSFKFNHPGIQRTLPKPKLAIITAAWQEDEVGGSSPAAVRYVPGMAGVLVELPLGGEDDERDLGVAEHGDLVRFLQQPVPALGEGHLSVDLVLDPPQLHRPAPHVADTSPSSSRSSAQR